ncbi:pro-interleukin-16 isoform X2 [Pipistrellus kuhlii]|uniref:pro-interleukin-16 isoform X2 n=1 Tax=Pipistrellus kuhlii TaxID=59472 RepID=UPI001E26F436|nr:pro-interleukin-16 isoform X2 [Pipistrellus kuhlii]
MAGLTHQDALQRFRGARKGLLSLTVRTRLPAPSSGPCALGHGGPPEAPAGSAGPSCRVLVAVSLHKEAGVGLGVGLCSVPGLQRLSGVFVHTLSPGSVAHLDGRLRCGDEIVEINAAPVACMTLGAAHAALSRCEPGPVPILVSRHPDPQVSEQQLKAAVAQATDGLWAGRERPPWSPEGAVRPEGSWHGRPAERAGRGSAPPQRRPQAMVRSSSDGGCACGSPGESPPARTVLVRRPAAARPPPPPRRSCRADPAAPAPEASRLLPPLLPPPQEVPAAGVPPALARCPGPQGGLQPAGPEVAGPGTPPPPARPPAGAEDPWVRISGCIRSLFSPGMSEGPGPGQGHGHGPPQAGSPGPADGAPGPLDIGPRAPPMGSGAVKKGPPVAPKPAWFRQSLRRLRAQGPDPGEPPAAASGSIRHRISSFETLGCSPPPPQAAPRPCLQPPRPQVEAPEPPVGQGGRGPGLGGPGAPPASEQRAPGDGGAGGTPAPPELQPPGRRARSLPLSRARSLDADTGDGTCRLRALSGRVSCAVLRSLLGRPASAPGSPRGRAPAEASPGPDPDPAAGSTDSGFSLNLSELRGYSEGLGELGEPPEATACSPAAGQAVLALLSAEELRELLEEVQELDAAALQQLESIHVTVLHKEEGAGLGFSLAGGADLESREVTVHRVFPSGLAAQEGTIRKGDEVLSINGKSLRGATHSQALAILRQAREPRQAVVVTRRPAAGARPSVEAPAPAAPAAAAPAVPAAGDAPSDPATEDAVAMETLTLTLEKTPAGLGFSLEGGRGSLQGDRPLTVNRVFSGAASGPESVRPGDEVLQLAGATTQGLTRFEAWSRIKALPDGPVPVIVRRRSPRPQRTPSPAPP